MKLRLATDAQPGRPNEDFAAASADAVVLVDGAGVPAGTPTGCCHGAAWYARTLGGLFLAAISPARPLTDALAEAIDRITTLHRDTCDLGHPGTPSAVVAAARRNREQVDHLVLGDCLAVLDRRHGGPIAVTDNRLARISLGPRAAMHALPIGSPAHTAARRELVQVEATHRNRPGGFWVASTEPHAAAEALTGSSQADELSAIALLSDGAARLVEPFRLAGWADILRLLADHGPAELIRRTRAAENDDPHGTRWPRAKAHDDATVAYWPLCAH